MSIVTVNGDLSLAVLDFLQKREQSVALSRKVIEAYFREVSVLQAELGEIQEMIGGSKPELKIVAERMQEFKAEMASVIKQSQSEHIIAALLKDSTNEIQKARSFRAKIHPSGGFEQTMAPSPALKFVQDKLDKTTSENEKLKAEMERMRLAAATEMERVRAQAASELEKTKAFAKEEVDRARAMVVESERIKKEAISGMEKAKVESVIELERVGSKLSLGNPVPAVSNVATTAAIATIAKTSEAAPPIKPAEDIQSKRSALVEVHETLDSTSSRSRPLDVTVDITSISSVKESREDRLKDLRARIGAKAQERGLR